MLWDEDGFAQRPLHVVLLGGAWTMVGLDKFSGDTARSRAASPKLLALNTASNGLVVGTGGVPLDLFLSTPVADWLKV